MAAIASWEAEALDGCDRPRACACAPAGDPPPLDWLFANVRDVAAAALGVDRSGILVDATGVRVVGLEPSPSQAVRLETLSVLLGRAVSAAPAQGDVARERHRIAHDLHDSVGQSITGLGLRLTLHLADAPDDAWRARLAELLALTDRANRELREAIDGLLFAEPEASGLHAAIRRVCREVEETCGIAAVFTIRGAPRPLGRVRQQALFRVAQEALRNVVRHANASTTTVELSYGADVVALVVHDDGDGLRGGAPGGPGRFGIAATRRRVEDAGGELRVAQAPNGGVVVEAVLPGGGDCA